MLVRFGFAVVELIAAYVIIFLLYRNGKKLREFKMTDASMIVAEAYTAAALALVAHGWATMKAQYINTYESDVEGFAVFVMWIQSVLMSLIVPAVVGFRRLRWLVVSASMFFLITLFVIILL